MIKHIIYRTTNKITGEYYIGLHKLNVLKPRNYWGSYWMRQPRSVRPYLIREVLAEYPDRESARQAEPLWIEPHLGNPLCKNTHARELPEEADFCDKSLSSEHIEKVRQYNLGKKVSFETKQKLREANLGENNPMWGKSHTKETRNKQSETMKNKPKVECPNCYKLVDLANAKRWHFDKCKKKP